MVRFSLCVCVCVCVRVSCLMSLHAVCELSCDDVWCSMCVFVFACFFGVCVVCVRCIVRCCVVCVCLCDVRFCVLCAVIA